MILITLIVVALICIGCYAIGYSDGKCDAKLRCNDFVNDLTLLYIKEINKKNKLIEDMIKTQDGKAMEINKMVNHLNHDDPVVMACKSMLKGEKHGEYR